MQLNFKARDWHNWLSVILAVPLVLVGLTSIFLAHKKEWKLNDVDLTAAVAWLPGYGQSAMAAEHADIRSSLVDADGVHWVGTQSGLFRVAGGKAEVVAALGDAPVRDLLRVPWGVVAATKYGVWTLRAGEDWQRAYKGDSWNASLNPDGSVAITIKDKGILLSRDGKDWQKQTADAEALAALPAEARVDEKISLGKLMIDLHTGKAFFGKAWEWVWIDILGAIWAFLGFTGIYMWWRSQTKRRDAARNKLPKELVHG